MIFNKNPFGYVTILMILTLNIATNDGEMLFHFADSNKYNYAFTFNSSAYIYSTYPSS